MAKVPCPPYDPCSLLGNTDFELPVKPSGSATFYPKDTIPCWDTDQSLIEIWTTGANASGPKLTPTGVCQPYTGTQFVELNSETVAPFFQTFTVPAGGMTGATLSFAHAGRKGCGGTNQMMVKILAGTGSGGAIEYTAPGNRPGNIYDANFEPDGITSKSEQIWTYYTIVLPFIAAGTHTLTFNAYDTNPLCVNVPPPISCACGNFLDAIDIRLQNPTVTVTASPAIVTVGGVIDLSANNTTDVVSWEWTDCNGTVVGTTQNISIPALTVDLIGCDFCCEVTNAFGCKAQACVNVKVQEGPACYRIIDCLGIQPDFITNTDMSDYLDKTIRICYYADSVDSNDCVPLPPECPHWPKGCYCVTVERVTVGCTSCPLEALIEAVYCDCEECLPKTYFQLLDCCTKEPYLGKDGLPYELSFNGMTSGPLPSDVDHRVLTTMVTNAGTITGCFELTIVDFNKDSKYHRWDDTVISVVTVATCADCQVCKTCYILTDCSDPQNTLVVGEDLSALIDHVITIEGCKDICWIVSGPVPDCVTKSSTTTTTQTTTTSIKHCCWTALLKGQDISILINGTPTNVPLGSAASMQTYLNGLSLGAWTVVEAPANIFTFCVTGSNTYGNMTLNDHGTIKIVPPQCETTTTNTTFFTSTQTCECSEGCDVIEDKYTTTETETIITKHCCWDGIIKDGTSAVAMIIDGVPVSIPFTLSGANILLYLNGLGVGTFGGTFVGSVFRLCVDGTNVYGNMLFTKPNGNYVITPVCSIQETINILISTYYTCICANGNPPVDPCKGCTPSITILSDYPPVQGEPDCASCLPQPPAPIPFTLHPRKIKPGYDTPGCDPAYTQKVSCTFGEQVYDAMVAVRYGIKICCDHDLQKWNIRKQLLDLRAIYDPALCANLIPPCPESCPPVCPVDPVICYCYTIFHQTTGSTKYKYTECLLGTEIVFTSSEIEAVNVCSRTIPVIVEISCGTEMSIIETVQASCTTNQDCSTLPLPCQCWVIESSDGCIFDYIDCNGVNQTLTAYPGKNYICSAIEPTPGIDCKTSSIQSLGECTDTSICNNLPCFCWNIILDVGQTCIYEYIDCDGNVLRINCVEGNNYVCSRVQPYHPDDVPVCSLPVAIELTGDCGQSFYCNTCICYGVNVRLRDGDFVTYINCDNETITVNLPANSSVEPYYICSKILPFGNASTTIVEIGACEEVASCRLPALCTYWVVTSTGSITIPFTYTDCLGNPVGSTIDPGQSLTICAQGGLDSPSIFLTFVDTNINCTV